MGHEDSASAAVIARQPMPDGAVASLSENLDLLLEAAPQEGEGLWAFAERYCGGVSAAKLIVEANGGRQRLLLGVRTRIPFQLLTPQYQLAVARALFDSDWMTAEGWSHQVMDGPNAPAESLWRVAEWFTGRGENYREIRQFNDLADNHLYPGQRLVIPARLLRPAFRAALPPTSPYRLEYGEDQLGSYAAYLLKPGEALYSSVVGRFAGLVFAEDVNSLAVEIAERNGIEDVTDIPIGYRVRVPLDVLLPEFLPAGHPRRRAYEEGLFASAQFSNQVEASHLQGITIVLDAGHGGTDVGTSLGGLWESVYVYDVMVRTKELLERTTAASVFATTRDDGVFSGRDRDELPPSRDHVVLTDPPYPIADSSVGVNLRWYLANSLFRRVTRNGGDPQKVVFLSLHANALHPSLRGAMVYIPGAQLRAGAFGKSGPVYASRREYREQPKVSFSRTQLTESEGLSRELAHSLLGALSKRDITVHDNKPVRDKIIRKRNSYVPAVLRYNEVRAAALVEICNLANAEDRALMRKLSFRQRVAEGLVEGILTYYGYSAEPALEIARAAR